MQQHLTPQQIEDMVARRVEPQELVTLTRHLSECEICRAAIRKPARTAERVSQLRRDLATERIAPPRWSLLDWLNQFKPLQLAAAGGAVALLIAAGVWVSRNTETPQPEKQIAVNQSSLPKESPQPAELSVELNDNNRRVGLNQSGALIGLPELPEELSLAISRALVSQKLEAPEAELKALRGRPATLMSGDEDKQSFKLTSPVGIIIATDRPEFRWQPLPNAQSYTVTVLDSDFNVVETSQPLMQLAQTVWRLPRALQRGRTYVWQVTAAVGDKTVASSSATAAEARFKIISAEQSRQLRQIRGQQSHLALGMFCIQTGLLNDAEREFQALLKSNPQSTVAQRLLNQARALAVR